MTTLWIAYAATGQEFAVQEQCEALGLRAIAPRRVDMKRLPKRRRPEAVESAALPNYVFVWANAEGWHRLRDCKHVRTIMGVSKQEERGFPGGVAPDGTEIPARLGLADFLADVQREYESRLAQIEAGQRVAEYEPGDVLEVMAGQFAGRLARFRRMIEGANDLPMIEAVLDLQLLGREVQMVIDPINARRAAE
jgi:transcriptional antiterminator NusG